MSRTPNADRPRAHRTARLRTAAILCAALVAGQLPGDTTAKAANGWTPPRTAVTSGTATSPLLPAPVGDAFYAAPEPLPGKPGDVIWAAPSADPVKDIFGDRTPLTEMPLFKLQEGTVRAEVLRILYHSTDRTGRSVPAFGILITHPLTRNQAPTIVSMHGWLGFADHCGVMRGPGKAVGGSAPALFSYYVGRGYSVMIPDGPGLSGAGVPTPLIHLNAARNLIDAAHAAQLLTGSTKPVLFQGHSMGGNMVLGVPGEASTYSPALRVAGILSFAGLGYSGAGTHMNAAMVSGDKSTARVSQLVIYATMLTEAYAGEIDVERHLTTKGKKRIRQVAELCNDQIANLLVLDQPDELFKPSFWKILGRDTGNRGRDGGVPVHFVDAAADSVVSVLPQLHAYRERCDRLWPTFRTSGNGNHATVVSETHALPEMQAWTRAILDGVDVGPGCAQVPDMLSVGHSYSVPHLVASFRLPLPAGAKTTLRAAGNCRVYENTLYTDIVGTCTFTIRAKPSKGPVVSASVTAVLR